MDTKTKKEIKRICNEWKYKYKFISGTDSFVVYGKLGRHHNKIYRGEYKVVTNFLLSEFLLLNYYVSDILYIDNKLKVTLSRLALS